MIDEVERRRLWQRTSDALAAARAHAGDRPGPPRPGDLLVVPPAAAAEVLWAIVEEAPEGGRLLAVPADSCPLVGSRDVVLPPDDPLGPLTLRCAFEVWIDVAALGAARRCGSIDAQRLGTVRQRRRELAAGEASGSVLEQQLDDDPDYREWCDGVVAGACKSLEEGRSWRLATPPRSRPDGVSRWAGLAASVLVLLGAGALIGAYWAVWRSTAEHRAAVADVERRLAAAEARRVVNPTLVWLTPRTRTRGEPRSVTLPPGGDGVALFLRVFEGGRFETYRLTIRKEPSDEVVWNRGGLRGDLEIPVVLDPHELPPGLYRLQLLAEIGEQGTPIAEYDLQIR